jgi:hypothetical protein
MQDRIQSAAQFSVMRACGFAAVAIVMFMVALAHSPAKCLKIGGLLVLLTTAVLILKAVGVSVQPYKSTEVWRLLRQEDRPSTDTAQRIISAALRTIYLEVARHTAAIAAVLLGLAVLLQLFGSSPSSAK